ncbi:MAG: extracellular solute-binding protein [Treponema sp.]|nr:extracellular solute-binding protein [Treponema sp.]
MKRTAFTVLLSFALAAALFASGGQSQQQQSSQSSGASIVTPPGTFPVVNTPISLKVFAGGSASIENFETNDFTKFYEQKTGIKLIWQVAPPTSITEQRRLSLASGDYPDFYMAAGITKDEEVLYGTEGVLIPLNNLIDTYGYWMKDMFSDLPDARAMITTPDGNIYSLPMAMDHLHALYPNKMFINTEWMNKLGLQTPVTTEDFYNVMMAFKTKDPNGNGKADEIPHITEAATGTAISGLWRYFVNSFIQMDANGFLVDKNNKVDTAYNKPELRQALAYVNRLVSDGLIDRTSFSISNAELRQLAENPGAQIIGSTVTQAPSSIYSMTSDRQKNFDAIAPLRGPGGVQLSFLDPSAQISTGALAITKSCKYPEAVVRWVDWFFNQEGLMDMRIGREGIEWDWAQPGDLSYTGAPALWINIGAQGGSTNAFWMQYGVASYNRHTKQKGFFDDKFYASEGLNTRLYVYTRDSYIPYKPANNLPPMYFEADVLNPIVQPLNDIGNYVNQMWARFATGDLALTDANWNNYVNTLNQMGIQNVISAYQKTFDTYLKNAGK